MQANATLVEQIREAERRAASAEERVRAIEAKAASPSSRLVAPRDEWGRMARERTIRLRLPCSTWGSGGRFVAVHAMRRFHVGRVSPASELDQRAAAAGFSTEELETMKDVYRRANATTWAAIRTRCEAVDSFRESISEAEEPTDAERIGICRSTMLDVHDDGARTALVAAAGLRAAGAPALRATSDEEHVAFVLTGAASSLESEMVRAFGREKTTLAIDNGALCFDETLYDLRTD
jgi:hypothetical protein